MFGSSVLDIALGLCFVFLLLSLVCSAANELIEMVLKSRAANLERGIAELIGDPATTKDFLTAIYQHGLVNSLYQGTYPATKERPSYIPAENFSLALLNLAATRENLPSNIKSALNAFNQTAAGDFNKLKASVENWYNAAMDRVSGWYKRRTQKILLAMGLVLAGVLNVDCINIARTLSNDASLRQSVVALAEATAKTTPAQDDKSLPVDKVRDDVTALDSLGLSIGWKKTDTFLLTGWPEVQRILGWLLTALAISLGAPFWFDMLNKIMVVRSTVKPHEKSREESSKDPVKALAAGQK